MNGERSYHGSKAAYILPNDTVEQQRLNEQGRAISALLSHQPYKASPTSPKRILDVGCGTGIMTAYLAEQFPQAEVIGVDLSDVPVGPGKPANITFVKGNIIELVNSGDARFAPGSFDFVFQRLLVFGVTDWESHVKGLASLLSKGGWLEIQEVELSWHNAEGRNLDGGMPWVKTLTEGMANKGLTLRPTNQIESHMKDFGLSPIRNDIFKMAQGPVPGNSDAHLWEQYAKKATPEMLDFLLTTQCHDICTQDELGAFKKDAAAKCAAWPEGEWIPYHVLTGQKPG